MSTALKLIDEIEKLPPMERAKIIDIVMRDMIHPDAEIESAWSREATSRWAAYKRGEVETIPYETVMARHRDKA